MDSERPPVPSPPSFPSMPPPGLPPVQPPSGPQTLPLPECEPVEDCGIEHECSYQRFALPGEAGGRVYQCVLCRAIGFRRPRFRGVGKIVHYTCSRPGCCGVARQRLHGRGPRGSYIWACAEHAVTIEAPKP